MGEKKETHLRRTENVVILCLIATESSLSIEEMEISVRGNQRGFTLVEITIVVAILALLVAISLPGLLRMRLNANEGAMKSDLRSFSSANESYRAAQTTPAYAASIAALSGPSPSYIDASWNTNPKHGYNLTYSAAVNTFGMLAVPASANDAVNSYCTDQTGQVFVGGAGPNTGCTGTPISA